MNYMWAPWRIAYITGPKQDGCVLCEKGSTLEDEVNLVLYRGLSSFVIMNLYPYNNGHLLICPLRHVAHLYELTPEEHREIALLLSASESILQEAMNPHGFNIGMNIGRTAGAGVEHHLHWHIVPRWNGDANFMSVVGETRVLPESLAGTYQRLSPRFKAIIR